MENILEISGLNKSYGDFALKDVSFSLPKGYIMGFVGQNGSGKQDTCNSQAQFSFIHDVQDSWFEAFLDSEVLNELPLHDNLNVLVTMS